MTQEGPGEEFQGQIALRGAGASLLAFAGGQEELPGHVLKGGVNASGSQGAGRACSLHLLSSQRPAGRAGQCHVLSRQVPAPMALPAKPMCCWHAGVQRSPPIGPWGCGDQSPVRNVPCSALLPWLPKGPHPCSHSPFWWLFCVAAKAAFLGNPGMEPRAGGQLCQETPAGTPGTVGSPPVWLEISPESCFGPLLVWGCFSPQLCLHLGAPAQV